MCALARGEPSTSSKCDSISSLVASTTSQQVQWNFIFSCRKYCTFRLPLFPSASFRDTDFKCFVADLDLKCRTISFRDWTSTPHSGHWARSFRLSFSWPHFIQWGVLRYPYNIKSLPHHRVTLNLACPSCELKGEKPVDCPAKFRQLVQTLGKWCW